MGQTARFCLLSLAEGGGCQLEGPLRGPIWLHTGILAILHPHPPLRHHKLVLKLLGSVFDFVPSDGAEGSDEVCPVGVAVRPASPGLGSLGIRRLGLLAARGGEGVGLGLLGVAVREGGAVDDSRTDLLGAGILEVST